MRTQRAEPRSYGPRRLCKCSFQATLIRLMGFATNGRMTLEQLSTASGRAWYTTRRAMRLMASKGFVERCPPTQPRKAWWQLTEAGAAMVKVLRAADWSVE